MDDDLIVCRCEEVTLGELRQVLRAGVTTPHGLKLFTRAGMGVCQGRTCRALIDLLIAAEAEPAAPGGGRPLSHRLPVRPVPLAVLAAEGEDEPCA